MLLHHSALLGNDPFPLDFLPKLLDRLGLPWMLDKELNFDAQSN